MSKSPASAKATASDDELPSIDLDSFNLNDIEGVLKMMQLSDSAASSAEGDNMIARTFGQDVDLRQVLSDNDERIDGLQEEYIRHHCNQAGEFLKLYNEISSCEGQLQGFETEISHFQERLTSTAEYIAQMQAETVSVVHKINNRKAVGHRFKTVYEALNECDTFCDAIAEAKTVDAALLNNLRQLESKLVLLDPELAGSAVQQDIDPRLTEAAEIAGPKLYEFLMEKFKSLLEDNTNVGLQQQAIERQGTDAFSFLWRYNMRIAEDLVSNYVRIMKEVYLRHVRAPRLAIEESNALSRHFEPLIPTELINSVKGSQQSGASPSMSLAASVSRVNGPSLSVKRQPSRSVSRALSDTIAKLRGKKEKEVPRRRATYVDSVNALRSMCVTYRLITIDPLIARSLDHSTCWVFSLVELCTKLVNDVINEQRFVDRFFFATGGSIESQEAMVRGVLDPSIVATKETILMEIPLLCDTASLLCALRLVEVARNYISVSSLEMPHLLLGETFSEITARLAHRLSQLMEVHVQSIVALNDSAPFQQVSLKIPLDPHRPLSEQTQGNAQLTEAMRAHDIVRRFAILTGQLHFVNSIRLEGSRVTEPGEGVKGDNVHLVFDSQLDVTLTRCVSLLDTAINGLSKRFPDPTASAVFSINCFQHIIEVWEHAEPAGLATPCVGHQIPIRSPRRARDASLERGDADTSMLSAGDAAEVSPITFTESYQAVQSALTKAIDHFVRLDVSLVATFAPIFEFVERCSALLPDEFFGQNPVDDAQDDDACTGKPEVVLPFNEGQVVELLTPFHKRWKEAIQETGAKVSRLLDGPRLIELVQRHYFRVLLNCLRRLRKLVKAFFDKPTIAAKLVGNVTLVHEIQKVVEQGMR